jgi:hypothetical protein
MLALVFLGPCVFGDGAECNGWGEFRGIRVEGQLLPFSTSVKIADPQGKILAFSATQTTSNAQFSRRDATQTSSAAIYYGQLSYRQTVEDIAPGTAKVTLSVTATRPLAVGGAYYYVTLPADLFSDAIVNYHSAVKVDVVPPVEVARFPVGKKYAVVDAHGIQFVTPTRTLDLIFDTPREISLQRDTFIDTDYKMQPELSLPVDPKSLDRIAFCFPLATGNMTQGQQASATFTIKTSVTPDKTPIKLALDLTHPGPGFDGIGGNFRIQSTQDQAHIAYNLENLRVAWGRVEMPLAQWQPQENVDPVATAPASATAPATAPARGGFGGRGGAGGPNNSSVRQAMEMARTLAQKNIPFFISTWSIPQWASAPAQRRPDQPSGIQAGRFNPDKMPALYKAIGSYLTYMKANYNAEPAAFSFNESDLGINVLFTPQEHADFIKGLGKYLEAQGLKTKLLLADAASPHPLGFITPAMRDPECRKYISGVSFHSWHDGTNEEFAAWGQAARELNVPLYCGEGGIDADAHRYPQIFSEPWFCLFEIQTYLGVMQYGQAASVLHWQLTENYGVLASRNGTLTPTRRFFHLKQLDLTPPGTPFLPLIGAAPEITHAAYGNDAKGYAIHLLNTGARRQITLTGLPASIKELHVVVTDPGRQMKELDKVPVNGGSATVTLDPEALTTLTSR